MSVACKGRTTILPLAVDEDVNGRIVRGLLRRLPHLDVVRVQDRGLTGTGDLEILEWAAREGRILLTQDANTMTGHAYARLTAGKHMAGVIVAAQDLAIGIVIEDLVLIAECTEANEWEAQVIFLPL